MNSDQGTVLIVDDERSIRLSLRTILSSIGFTIIEAGRGEEALALVRTAQFDAVLLDINMPGMGGVEVCRIMRKNSPVLPIVMLTVQGNEERKVDAFEAGADDYITKPFSFDVLLARLRARTRDASGEPQLVCGDLALDTDRHEASRKGLPLHLTRTEFAILECLLRASGRVVTRGHLIDTVWGAGADVTDNNLDAFMGRLRAKVDAPGNIYLIHTVRGIGYSLRGSPRN